MNISIEKRIFSECVSIATRFADRKNTSLPALSSLLILAGDDGIKLRATNLETGVDLKLPGTVKREGVVAVPAAILQQIATSLSGEGSISLEQTGETLFLSSGMGKSSIKTVPVDDFPTIPFPENPKNRVVMPGADLQLLLTTLAGCASSSTVRPELASVYIALEGGVLTAAATDSFRLTEKKITLSNKGTQGSFLIPAKNALDIAQALPKEDIILSFDENQCAFIANTGMFVSRLTNASYPDYKQIIPKESVSGATLLRKDFEAALKRTAIFSDAFQKVRLSFDQKKNTITLFAKNTDIGEASEHIPARIEGSDIELSFNHRYLATILSLTSAESLVFSAAGIGRPLVVRGVGDPSFLYLVSPMNQ